MGFKRAQLLFCFLLLTFGCLILKAQGQTDNSKTPTINYCDLVKEPVKYDNKIIRTEVIYFVFFENSRMSDKACKEAKWTWVEFDSAVTETTDQELLKKFEQSLPREESDPPSEIKVVWVGLFQGIKPVMYKEGDLTLYQGFGHMGRYDYQFTVQKIEQLTPIKLKIK